MLYAFSADYSVSVWLKSTQSFGSDGEQAYSGAGILAADVPGTRDDLIPVALTGGQVATFTGNPDTTVNSISDINDGNWHHVVVTRQQSSGTLQLYVDGNLTNSASASTAFLADPQLVTLGALANAGQGEPDFCGPYGNYSGLLDDLQIYNTVLTSNDVAYLFNNPGQTVATNSATGPNFNLAVNTTNLDWSDLGNSLWFTEASVTHDGVLAAQSGPVTFAQTSLLETTVSGPATLTFWWQTTASDSDFSLEFDLDSNYWDSIGGDTSWF